MIWSNDLASNLGEAATNTLKALIDSARKKHVETIHKYYGMALNTPSPGALHGLI